MDQKQLQLVAQIDKIKAELTALGRLRPGSLSRQARIRGSGYLQLTYTHRGQTRCQYVRPDYAPVIREELATYRRFRELCREWVERELQLSRLKQQAAAHPSAGAAPPPGGGAPPPPPGGPDDAARPSLG